VQTRNRYADKSAPQNKQDPPNETSTLFVVGLIVAVVVVMGLLLLDSYAIFSIPTCATTALHCGAP
jgi:hypothetical protein